MGDIPAELISVACPNHHEMLIGGLWQCFNSNHRVDLNFQLNGKTVGAHQLILELFLSLEKLTQVVTRSGQPGSFPDSVKLERSEDGAHRDTTMDTLSHLFEFVYNGRVAVQREELDRLVTLAKELDFQLLVDAAEKVGETNNVPKADAVKPNCVQTRRFNRRNGKGRPVKRLSSRQPESLSDSDGSGERWSAPTKKRSRQQAKTQPEVDDAGGSSDDSDDPDSSHDPEETGVKGEDGGSDPVESDNAKKSRGKVRRSGTGGRQLHKCQFCGYQTGIKATFQIHLTKHDPTMLVYKCQDCSRKFLTEASLERHKLKHAGGPEIYECPHCDYKIRTKTRYKIHLAKHDPTVAVFRCGTCGRQVFNEEALQRHMRKHKTYQCGHCEFETPKRWSYDHHLFSKHQVNCRGEPVTRLLCDEDGCTYSCKTESELKYHRVAKHSGDRPHKCEQCNFSSGRKGDVGKHVKAVHLNLKPHLCESCGYRTVSQSALEQHKRTHTGQKVFKCDVCEKSYGDHSTLRRHKQVTHGSDGKPYVCHVCANSYNRRDHLRIHLTKAHDLTTGSI